VDNKIASFQLNQLPKKTFEITVEIPWPEVEKTQETIIEEQGKQLEIKGFRKGMVPKNMVKDVLGKEKLIRLVLEKILPDLFQKAVEELKLKPILSPKVDLISTDESKDWQVKFLSCEEPEITLGNYKEEIKKALGTKAKIWTPGEGKEEKPQDKENEKEKKINIALEWLLKNLKIEISDLLIEDEVNRKLSGLIDQTQKLGLTVEQYLASSGKKIDSIKEEYAKQSQENLLFEFILGKIADEEKISVTEEDLNKAAVKAESETQEKVLEGQKYYLAILLRRQKTLDFLAGL